MKFLLKLKHWQLFALTWGVPIIVNFFTFGNPALLFKLFPLQMVFFGIGTWGWIWAIAVELNPYLPPNTGLSARKFKLLFSIPITYLAIILIGLSTPIFQGFGGEGSALSGFEGILILVHLVSVVIVFYGLNFAAKTVKSVELNRTARFSDYSGEFFLIWFSVFGYWILQPRLNRIISNMPESENTD